MEISLNSLFEDKLSSAIKTDIRLTDNGNCIVVKMDFPGHELKTFVIRRGDFHDTVFAAEMKGREGLMLEFRKIYVIEELSLPRSEFSFIGVKENTKCIGFLNTEFNEVEVKEFDKLIEPNSKTGRFPFSIDRITCYARSYLDIERYISEAINRYAGTSYRTIDSAFLYLISMFGSSYDVNMVPKRILTLDGDNGKGFRFFILENQDKPPHKQIGYTGYSCEQIITHEDIKQTLNTDTINLSYPYFPKKIKQNALVFMCSRTETIDNELRTVYQIVKYNYSEDTKQYIFFGSIDVYFGYPSDISKDFRIDLQVNTDMSVIMAHITTGKQMNVIKCYDGNLGDIDYANNRINSFLIDNVVDHVDMGLSPNGKELVIFTKSYADTKLTILDLRKTK